MMRPKVVKFHEEQEHEIKETAEELDLDQAELIRSAWEYFYEHDGVDWLVAEMDDEDTETYTRKELNEMLRSDLADIARDLDIAPSRMNRDELIEGILEAQKEEVEQEEENEDS